MVCIIWYAFYNFVVYFFSFVFFSFSHSILQCSSNVCFYFSIFISISSKRLINISSLKRFIQLLSNFGYVHRTIVYTDCLAIVNVVSLKHRINKDEFKRMLLLSFEIRNLNKQKYFSFSVWGPQFRIDNFKHTERRTERTNS